MFTLYRIFFFVGLFPVKIPVGVYRSYSQAMNKAVTIKGITKITGPNMEGGW